MNLHKLLNTIRPADSNAYAACAARFNAVAKPIGSLGKLEALLERVAAITGDPAIDIGKKCVLVFCADNGVLAQGVAQSTSDVTTAIARSLAAGTASVNVMARACGADVFPVDMGISEAVPGLLDRRLGAGTGDISQGPAMSRETAERAILTGIELVGQRREEGYQVIATGEAGIGNTTTSSALVSVLLDKPIIEVTGRGAGLSDAGLMRKHAAIARAIEVNKPDPADALDVLHKIGGLDIAAIAGAFIGGAVHRIPVVVDGFISSAAALVAARLCPNAKDFMLASHVSGEPAGRMVMDALGLEAPLHARLALGEGTGAVTLFPLLEMALAVYHQNSTFEKINLAAYTRFEEDAK